MNSTEQFQVGKHNIGWLDSDFKKHFDGQTFEPSAAMPTFQKLGKRMTDAQIESELKPGYCTLGDVYTFLQNPPEGSKDGWGNLFFFPQCVVRVVWFSGGAGWGVLAWLRGGNGWRAESRVFSPATGSRVLRPLSSESLTLGNVQKAIMYLADSFDTVNGKKDVRSKIYEIFYPADPNKFMECDTCRGKPGSPPLCKGCIHNRSLIEKLTSKK